jgi:hypothetical protein
MSHESSRYEINIKVRSILVRHNADMTKIGYSSSNKTVSIYGFLLNNDNTDFSISTVTALVSELMNIPSVNTIQFDLENWIIVADLGELIIIKGKEFATKDKLSRKSKIE